MAHSLKNKKPLVQKIKHPAFWTVAGARILGGLLFFINPWWGWLLWIALDFLDSIPWRYIAGFTSEEYEIVDKKIDSIDYVFMLLASWQSPYFIWLTILLIYREIGQYIFDKTKDEKIFIFFPNLFEVLWIWVIALPFANLHGGLLFLLDIRGLIFIFIIKMFIEYFKHYWGPKYYFKYSSKKMSKLTESLRK